MITFKDLCGDADPDEVRRIIKGSYKLTPVIKDGLLVEMLLEEIPTDSLGQQGR